MLTLHAPPPPERTATIAQARRQWFDSDNAPTPPGAPLAPWITRSWERCLRAGQRPQQGVSFDAVSRQQARAIAERHRALVNAARPVLDRLSRTLADTRYFPILTDARGVVIDVGALPVLGDGLQRRALDIARIGVDLSEPVVGTTAIGTALAEQDAVWLHRGEHFLEATSVYSCAGAPLFGPDGDCIGMLDLTGVNALERPELKHLAQLSARSIENALIQQHPCALLLQLAWPGCAVGTEATGLLCLDESGRVTGSNAAARQMLHYPQFRAAALHSNDLFAVPLSMLFDAARRDDVALELPLWSGLRVRARVQRPGRRPAEAAFGDDAAKPRLRELEADMIRRAVDEARGNVAEAARALGISRATVYRKLWQVRHREQ